MELKTHSANSFRKNRPNVWVPVKHSFRNALLSEANLPSPPQGSRSERSSPGPDGPMPLGRAPGILAGPRARTNGANGWQTYGRSVKFPVLAVPGGSFHSLFGCVIHHAIAACWFLANSSCMTLCTAPIPKLGKHLAASLGTFKQNNKNRRMRAMLSVRSL